MTIPTVNVRGVLYSDVSVTVGEVISVGSCTLDSRSTFDEFDTTTSRLRIPKVVKKDGSASYFNVVITIKEVLSLGSSCTSSSISNGQVITGTSSCRPSIYDNIDPCNNPTWFVKSGLLPEFLPLWDKYSWKKPSMASEVYTVASQNSKNYASSIRSPDTYVNVVAQSGVDTTFLNWVKQGGNFVAKAFSYPVLSKPLLEVVAIDRNFYYQTLVDNNIPSWEVFGNMSAFDGGAPAWGGTILNSYNY